MLTEQHLRSILQINTLIVKAIRRKVTLKMYKATTANNCEGKAIVPKMTKWQKQGIRKTIIKCIRRDDHMLERVAEIIREQLNQEEIEITEATRFKEDLEVDSLDLFELVMAFEEEYGVSIPSEDLEGLTSVGDVIKYLQEHGVEA